MNATKREGQPTFRTLPPATRPPAPAGSPVTGPDAHRGGSLSDRRTSLRGPVQTKAKLTILEGPHAGEVHDILTRDQSLAGISFLLRGEGLKVGQECEIQFEGAGQKKFRAEVTRSRGISAGRYELGVQFRRQV